MSDKLQFHRKKVLKLTNVLKYTLELKQEDFNFNVCVEQMQSYIKTKGALQIGSLIQYTRPFVNDANELDMEIKLFLQCNHDIHTVDPIYSMDSVIRIPDCLYCRYIGPEEQLKFAYDKIQLEAFEADMELTGESYTVFVNSNEAEGTIVADVFMPQA